jgi:large-conductance mechanosensitive channel
MRKYFGVLLMGLGGGIILMFLIIWGVVIFQSLAKLKTDPAAYSFGFFLGELLILIIVAVVSFFLIRTGRRMLNSVSQHDLINQK